MIPFALTKRSGKRKALFRGVGGRFAGRRDATKIIPGLFKTDARKVDPTETGNLRNEFAAQIDRRAVKFKSLVSEALTKSDAFGIGPLTVQSVSFGGDNGAKIQAFSDWLQRASEATFLDFKGGWVGLYVGGAYKRALTQAADDTGKTIDIDPKRGNAFSQKAANELRGIVAATEQQMNRAFSNGLMSKHLPRDIASATIAVIEDVLVKRAHMLVEQSVINAHAEATLDALQSLGVTHVGLIGEMHFVTDASADDVDDLPDPVRPPRKRPKNWKEYRRLRTKRDARVCPLCDEVDGNVYLIDDARGMIPLHPRCRCKFVSHYLAVKDFKCEAV